MSESVGGFYASLKLNVDSGSFARGNTFLEKMRQQNARMYQFQKRMANQQAQEERAMYKDRLNRKLDIKAVARGIDMPFSIAREGIGGFFTSLKWLTGGIVAATSAFAALSVQLSKNWSEQQKVAQSARGLSVSPAWLKRWESAERIAGAPTGTMSEVSNGIQKMLANPAIGQTNPELITAISGILGLKTKDPKLAFQALSNMSPENQSATVVQALQKMMGGDWKSKTQAKTISGMLSGGLENLLTFAQGGAAGAYKLGTGATLVSDAEIRASEKASIATALAMENLRGAWDLFASNMATELTPYLNEFNSWFAKNGPTIKSALHDFASFLGQTVGWMTDLVKDPMGTLSKSYSGVEGAGNKWKDGVNQDAGYKILDFFTTGRNPFYEGPRVVASKSEPSAASSAQNIVIYATIDGKNIPVKLSKVERYRDTASERGLSN